jgi:probable F420-dependent oxidoreductase
MKIGLNFYNSPPGPEGADGAFFSAWVIEAEKLGYDSIWIPEHLVMPMRYTSKYPFQEYAEGEDFKPFPLADVAFHEPLTMLTWAAALTSTIELCTGIVVIPARNPVVLAKQAASLARLSGDRLRLGVGLGWLREEVEATGLPWAGRGRRTEEMIAVMRALWTNDVATFTGEDFAFDSVCLTPRPQHPDGVPVYLGGNSAIGARRAGRLGQGFIVHPPSPEGDQWIPVMQEAAIEAGREPGQIEVIGALLEPDAERLLEMQSLGYTHVYLASAVGASAEVALAEMHRTTDALAPVWDELRGA